MAEISTQIWELRGTDAFSEFTGLKRLEGESQGRAGDPQMYTDEGGRAPSYLTPSPFTAAPLAALFSSSHYRQMSFCGLFRFMLCTFCCCCFLLGILLFKIVPTCSTEVCLVFVSAGGL